MFILTALPANWNAVEKRGGGQGLFLALWPSGGGALPSYSPYMCHQLQYVAGSHFRGGSNRGEGECQMGLVI